MPKSNHVKHPYHEYQKQRDKLHPVIQWNDKVLEWFADKGLGSILGFDLALIIPLLAIPAPEWFKVIVILISSTWIQLWALFALQRSQKKADTIRQIKADIEQETLQKILEDLEVLKNGKI